MVQFKAEWKTAGKAGKWQTEIVDVSKIVCFPHLLFLEPLFWGISSPGYIPFSGYPLF